MLDDTANMAVALPQQDAATAYDRCQVPSGSRPGPVWCVVAALPKAERTAHAALHRFGFEAYCPWITYQWRDRTWHTAALFRGYLFVRLDLTKPWHPVRHAPGVFDLIAFDGTPSICPDAVVDALRAGEALRATPPPAGALWAPGMPCSLGKHALAGAPAVVISVERHKAVIGLMMLGHLRQISVPIDSLRARDE